MEQFPNNEEIKPVNLTEEEFNLIRNVDLELLTTEENNKAFEIIKEKGLLQTADRDGSVQIEVNGEKMKMCTWELDYGTILEEEIV